VAELTFLSILKDWLSKDKKQEMAAIVIGLILSIISMKIEGKSQLLPLDTWLIFSIHAIIFTLSVFLIQYFIIKYFQDNKHKMQEMENIKRLLIETTFGEKEGLAKIWYSKDKCFDMRISDDPWISSLSQLDIINVIETGRNQECIMVKVSFKPEVLKILNSDEDLQILLFKNCEHVKLEREHSNNFNVLSANKIAEQMKTYAKNNPPKIS
jgi:hypothetical protein